MLSSVKMEAHDLPEWNTFYSEASEVKKLNSLLNFHHVTHKLFLLYCCLFVFMKRGAVRSLFRVADGERGTNLVCATGVRLKKVFRFKLKKNTYV